MSYEVCGHEHDGLRCANVLGHIGDHESAGREHSWPLERYPGSLNTDTYGDETSPPARRLAAGLAVGIAAAALVVGSAAARPPSWANGKPKPSHPSPTPTLVPTPTVAPTPTASSTIAPSSAPSGTPAPTGTPPPTPTIAPTPTATAACPGSLQVAINNTPSGGTLTLGSCTFHESVSFPRSMTVRGQVVIDGDGVRQTWVTITVPDVTLDGLTFRNAAAGAYQCGSVDVSATRFVLKNSTLAGGCYADVRLWPGATSAQILDNDISNGPAVGVLGYQANGATIAGGRLHDNNGSTNPGNEAGGAKLCQSTGVTVRDLETDHNVGPGIWLDCYDNGSSITGVSAHDNTRSGLMVEIDDTVTVSGNTVYRNGTEPGGNAYESRCGIMVSSSRNVTVTNNTVAWNPAGNDVCIVSQNRDPLPHTGNSVTGNVLRTPPSVYTDFGDTSPVVTSPNTIVADDDPRISGLR